MIEALKYNLVLFVVCFIVFVLSVISHVHMCACFFPLVFFRAGLDMIHVQCICYWVNTKKRPIVLQIFKPSFLYVFIIAGYKCLH